MDLDIPAGSTVSVAIPKDSEKYILNGKSHKARGPIAEVESGHYSFEWNSPKK
jgi:hypothetical protein